MDCPRMEFDPDGDKWRCCCWSLPSGLTVLACTELVVSSISAALFIGSAYGGFLSYPNTIAVPVGVLSVCLAFSALLLLLGTRCCRHQYFMAVMAIQSVAMLGVLGISIGLILFKVQERHEAHLARVETEDAKGTGALQLVLLPIIGACVVIAVLIYSVYMAQKGYHYFGSLLKLRRKRADRGSICTTEPIHLP